MLKKKFCNFRPFLVIAIAMIVSVALAVFVVEGQTLRFVIFATLFILAIIAIILFFVNKNKIFIFLTSLFIFVSIPFISISFKSFKLEDNLKYETTEVLIMGKISDHYKITDRGYLKITLDENEISFSSGDIVEWLDGKIVIYTNHEYIDVSKLNIGTYILASVDLDFNTISSKDQWELSNLGRDVVASGFTDYYQIKIYDERDVSVADIVKSGIYNTLKSTGMEHADVSYAMMFGDSNIVDIDVKTIFQSSGIAHLLAVSGLHVSAIVFAISFLLKKMKFSQKTQLVVLSVLLTFYCYLCNFSISVIRASLMAIILNYTYIRGKAYDRLSVLSLLAAVILLVNPMQLFNISFILSFSAVISIIFLAPPLTRIFKKIFYDKFANTLGVLFATQVGLAAVNVFYFHTLQPLSFLANMVSIPLATSAFILIIIAVILVMIFPILSPVCQWIGELFIIISQYNNYITSLGMTLSLPAIPALVIPIAFMLLFVVSDYCFFNKKIKIPLAVCLCLCYGALIFV